MSYSLSNNNAKTREEGGLFFQAVLLDIRVSITMGCWRYGVDLPLHLGLMGHHRGEL
jgi:hypothetical protein